MSWVVCEVRCGVLCTVCCVVASRVLLVSSPPPPPIVLPPPTSLMEIQLEQEKQLAEERGQQHEQAKVGLSRV